ncbi:protein rhomboid-like [Panonychus citri]|uniref:protein rhomboid-like n=1 Tax=Panonychus citri TaxID=50023 RepID=UPI002307B46D|nr:protein rhomboid-like [Panonychus citri]
MDLVDTDCVDSDLQRTKNGENKNVAFEKMVNCVADNFLDDLRDRKYYADTYKCWPPPIFIISVTLIQLLYFIHFLCFDSDEMTTMSSVLSNDLFIYRPDKRQEFWRFAFYMVLHTGWTHLLFNIITQLLIGLPLEMVHGSTRIGTIYMAGILAGSLGTSVFDSDVYLVGASGGVYALLAAHIANVILNNKEMKLGFLRVCGILLIASFDVGFAVYERYSVKEESVQTSYVAHFTGALAGLTIGLIVLKNFEQKLHEQFIWWLALTGYIICMAFAIIYNVLH